MTEEEYTRISDRKFFYKRFGSQLFFLEIKDV